MSVVVCKRYKLTMNTRWFVFCLLALCSSSAHGGYCDTECKEKHTMCKYPNDGPGPACAKYENHLFSAHEKTAILNKHNELRRMVANGEVPQHPKALNMVDLQWSDEAAAIARRWALQCTYRHDSCRYLLNSTHVGQNIYQMSSDKFINSYMTGVKMWFDEYKLYKPDSANLYPRGVGGVGHYTQLVWAKSTHLGCERTFFDKYEYLVCNYSPAGNMVGDKVYEASAVSHSGCVVTLVMSLIIASK